MQPDRFRLNPLHHTVGLNTYMDDSGLREQSTTFLFIPSKFFFTTTGFCANVLSFHKEINFIMVLVSYKDFKPVPPRSITPRALSPQWGNDIRNPSSQKGLRNVAQPDELENEYADREATQVIDSFFGQYSEEPIFLQRLKHKIVEKLHNERTFNDDGYDYSG
jgi:hypothetical protein